MKCVVIGIKTPLVCMEKLWNLVQTDLSHKVLEDGEGREESLGAVRGLGSSVAGVSSVVALMGLMLRPVVLLLWTLLLPVVVRLLATSIVVPLSRLPLAPLFGARRLLVVGSTLRCRVTWSGVVARNVVARLIVVATHTRSWSSVMVDGGSWC